MKGHVENVRKEGGDIILTVRVRLLDGPRGNPPYGYEASVEYHEACIAFLRENMRIRSLHTGEIIVNQDIVPDDHFSIERHKTAIAGLNIPSD